MGKFLGSVDGEIVSMVKGVVFGGCDVYFFVGLVEVKLDDLFVVDNVGNGCGVVIIDFIFVVVVFRQ